MAYEDWPAGYQDLFDQTTDILSSQDYFLSPADLQYAINLFEESFLPNQDFMDVPGVPYTWDDVRGEDFFDFLGIPEELFDWEAWRELYEAG